MIQSKAYNLDLVKLEAYFLLRQTDLPDSYINAYSAAPQYSQAVMDKIMGRSEFEP
mgnify:CR=1 FL=1